MAIALSDVRFRGQSGRQSQRAPGIREQPRTHQRFAMSAFGGQSGHRVEVLKFARSLCGDGFALKTRVPAVL
jgi:hypothetical protein